MDEYTGYLELSMTDEALASIYERPEQNFANLMQNQYLIVQKQDDEPADALKWNGSSLVRVPFSEQARIS